jgi:hypothetical protein
MTPFIPDPDARPEPAEPRVMVPLDLWLAYKEVGDAMIERANHSDESSFSERDIETGLEILSKIYAAVNRLREVTRK